MVEEGKGLAGLEGLEPEGDLAELDGHGVDVHAVEAVADDVAQGGLVEERGGLGLAIGHGAGAREVSGEAMGGPDEEMTGAAGHVTGLEAEDGLGGQVPAPEDGRDVFPRALLFLGAGGLGGSGMFG